jgi:hypothetical protein
MEILRRLFSRDRSQPSALVDCQQHVVADTPREQDREVTDRYYDNLGRIEAAMSRRDYEVAADEARKGLKLIPEWVNDTRASYGRFDISSIPAIEQGSVALALQGDEAGLREMAAVVDATPELAPWAGRVEQAFGDLQLMTRIRSVVAEQPGRLQTALKSLVGEVDGSRIARLTSYLEKAGMLARVKSGRTYALFPPGSSETPIPPPKREVSSHRPAKAPPRIRKIEIADLDYVPLPRSPPRWEEARRQRAKVLEAVEPFEVRDAGWKITSVDKVPPPERPDPAFRISRPCGTGVILIDDLGKAEGLGAMPASALRYNRAGQATAKAGLLHDTYRLGVHPLGSGLIALSREAVLHAYDDDLKPILETALGAAPEIAQIRKRFEIPDAELKNHLRCVALAGDGSRYLFTIVDEAWCVSLDGTGLWGASLPVKDGWAEVAAASEFGTSDEVHSALRLMDLALPITPDEVKSRYRMLAKQWHPDLNPGDPAAEEKMKSLSAAAAALTGIEASALPKYAGAVFGQELHRSTVEAGGQTFTITVGLQAGEKFAADWIYAAGFAASSNGAYLAGYSGRIVEVNERGEGLRVYDIGAVPRQIIDTGSYLYLLTDTRLYVMCGDALHALIDTFDGGELLVAKSGFGLLEKKRMRWFTPDGTYAGSVVTKDPIRRVYFVEDHLVVETRQSKATVKGAPAWWPRNEETASQ